MCHSLALTSPDHVGALGCSCLPVRDGSLKPSRAKNNPVDLASPKSIGISSVTNCRGHSHQFANLHLYTSLGAEYYRVVNKADWANPTYLRLDMLVRGMLRKLIPRSCCYMLSTTVDGAVVRLGKYPTMAWASLDLCVDSQPVCLAPKKEVTRWASRRPPNKTHSSSAENRITNIRQSHFTVG